MVPDKKINQKKEIQNDQETNLQFTVPITKKIYFVKIKKDQKGMQKII